MSDRIIKQPSQISDMIAVRMDFEVDEANELHHLLPRVPEEVRDRLHDQFWLLTILREQRRRVGNDDRRGYDHRCDKILAALDPQEEQ